MDGVLVGRAPLVQDSPTEVERLFAEFRRSGDPRALGTVYDRLAPELLRVALHTARDAAEAEDVLQATFVAAIERAQHFDPTRRVLPWLVGILAHEARKARARAARRPDPARLEPGPSSSPEEEAGRAELLALLDGALGRIPPAFRPVLQLRVRHALSVSEIAAALELPPGTVRSRLARGTECLRRALPASLARALVLVAPSTRGLALVRDDVLAHAAAVRVSVQTATTGGALIGGTLVMKKLVGALAALLLLASTVYVLGGPTRPSPTLDGTPAGAPVLVAPPRLEEAGPRAAQVAPLRADPAREARAPLPAPPPLAPELARLVVLARWSDGSPAAGEVVLVRDARSPRLDDDREARTGADGRAHFESLAPGSAYVRLLRGGESGVALEAGRTTALELAVRAGVTVVGSVLDEDGAPVPEAEVWLSERYRDDLGHVVARSDADGRFELCSVGPDHCVGARRAGFAPSSLRWLGGGQGDRREVALVLARGSARVHGQVLDPRGEPVPRALVLVGAERPERVRIADGSFVPAAPPQRARTDEQGRFELDCVPLGLQPLQVRAAGCAPLASTLELHAGDSRALCLELVRAPSVRGSARTADGRALAGVEVVAGDPEAFAGARAWSGTDGRFELDDLPVGPIALAARHAEHGEARLELDLAPGEVAEWPIRLQPAARIHGRLVDERGTPLEELVVVALRADERGWRSRSNRTGADGRFALAGLEDREHLLWVQPSVEDGGWRGFPLLERRAVRPDAAPLELVVPAAAARGRIEAEIVGPGGEPVAGAELQVWHEEARLWRAFVSGGERGTVVAELVPPGSVELELRHPAHPWKRLGTQRIESGATLRLGTVALAAGGSLRAEFVGLAPGLEGGLEAQLTDASQRESGVARLAPGRLEAGPLAAGEHVLVLGGDGVRQLRIPFTIHDGRETLLHLRPERCGAREVVFSLPENGPTPEWLSCSLLDQAGTLVWGGSAARAGNPPSVRVSAPAGLYRLLASGPRGLRGEAELVIGAAGSASSPFPLFLQRDP